MDDSSRDPFTDPVEIQALDTALSRDGLGGLRAESFKDRLGSAQARIHCESCPPSLLRFEERPDTGVGYS
jgi:hypothetical protein